MKLILTIVDTSSIDRFLIYFWIVVVTENEGSVIITIILLHKTFTAYSMYIGDPEKMCRRPYGLGTPSIDGGGGVRRGPELTWKRFSYYVYCVLRSGLGRAVARRENVAGCKYCFVGGGGGGSSFGEISQIETNDLLENKVISTD